MGREDELVLTPCHEPRRQQQGRFGSLNEEREETEVSFELATRPSFDPR